MKERIIPSRLTSVTQDDELGITIYASFEPTERCQCEAMAFIGKSSKPAWYYGFKSKEQFDRTVCELFASRKSALEAKAKRQAERKAAADTIDVKVGDIFCSSWGYDQTNIDYYEVVATSAKMATVRAIAADCKDEPEFMTGSCVPVPGKFISEKTRRVKLQKYSAESEPYFTVNSFASAERIKPISVVDNKPVFKADRYSYYA